MRNRASARSIARLRSDRFSYSHYLVMGTVANASLWISLLLTQFFSNN